MQSPTTTCQYCRKRRADQTLFTSYMRCGEGDATKRNAHLCEGCRHHAMLVLDRIGMTIAFEGDGQLRWDAHVKLSDTATRSLARRAMQREDLLLHLDDPSAAARAPEPTEPEKLSLIHQLAVEEALVESDVDRGREFWPEDPCRLTASGKEAAALIRKRRRAEADGLPIKEWSPRYVPEQGTDEEFREYANRVVISPDGDRYDGSDHLMLRQDGDRAPSVDITSEPQAHLLFQPELWTSRPIRPDAPICQECTVATTASFVRGGLEACGEYSWRTPGASGVPETGMGGLRPLRGRADVSKALAALGSVYLAHGQPRPSSRWRGSSTSFRPCRVTAAADRAGSPCGPAERLARDPLPGSATSGSRSFVAENPRQLPDATTFTFPAAAPLWRGRSASMRWASSRSRTRPARPTDGSRGIRGRPLRRSTSVSDLPLTGSCNAQSPANVR